MWYFSLPEHKGLQFQYTILVVTSVLSFNHDIIFLGLPVSVGSVFVNKIKNYVKCNLVTTVSVIFASYGWDVVGFQV